MMLNGGDLNGNRIPSSESVELMTTNQVGDKAAGFIGNGLGYGLGFYTLQNVRARGALGSTGEYGWAGTYHCTYWVDPEEEIVVLYLTQVMPANGFDDDVEPRALAYQAIEDLRISCLLV